MSPASETLEIWTCHRDNSPIMSHASSSSDSPDSPRASGAKGHDSTSDANIRNFAPVARIMKTALPENAKIAKEAKECMQECVSEFISFITSEGMSAQLYHLVLRNPILIVQS